MFAIIKSGGKQYMVQEGTVLFLELLEGEAGANVEFSEVLLSGNSALESLKIGSPFIEGGKVTGKILEQGKGVKKIVFRYKSKTRYKKKKGHRQPFTKVEITKITA